MSEIVKICLHHGPLKEDQVHKETDRTKKRGYMLRCNQCKLDKDRRWKENNWEKHKQSAGKARMEARRLYREGKTKVEPKANAWKKLDRERNKEKYLLQEAKYRLKQGQMRNIQEICRRRGITRDRYFEMFDEQNHKCAICFQEEKRISRNFDRVVALAIDHCHVSSKVRGLLCTACNVMIGHAGDDITRLQSAIEYLKKHQ
jgi:hypothetical protein